MSTCPLAYRLGFTLYLLERAYICCWLIDVVVFQQVCGNALVTISRGWSRLTIDFFVTFMYVVAELVTVES